MLDIVYKHEGIHSSRLHCINSEYYEEEEFIDQEEAFESIQSGKLSEREICRVYDDLKDMSNQGVDVKDDLIRLAFIEMSNPNPSIVCSSSSFLRSVIHHSEDQILKIFIEDDSEVIMNSLMVLGGWSTQVIKQIIENHRPLAQYLIEKGLINRICALISPKSSSDPSIFGCNLLIEIFAHYEVDQQLQDMIVNHAVALFEYHIKPFTTPMKIPDEFYEDYFSHLNRGSLPNVIKLISLILYYSTDEDFSQLILSKFPVLRNIIPFSGNQIRQSILLLILEVCRKGQLSQLWEDGHVIDIIGDVTKSGIKADDDFYYLSLVCVSVLELNPNNIESIIPIGTINVLLEAFETRAFSLKTRLLPFIKTITSRDIIEQTIQYLEDYNVVKNIGEISCTQLHTKDHQYIAHMVSDLIETLKIIGYWNKSCHLARQLCDSSFLEYRDSLITLSDAESEVFNEIDLLLSQEL